MNAVEAFLVVFIIALACANIWIGNRVEIGIKMMQAMVNSWDELVRTALDRIDSLERRVKELEEERERR